MADFESPISYQVTNPIAVDKFYGGWPSVAAANLAVPVVLRLCTGPTGASVPRTVGIVIGGVPIEYWWFGGTADINLVPKASSVGGGSSLAPFFVGPLTADDPIAAPADGFYIDALYDLGADINPLTGISATGSGKKYVLQNFPTDPEAAPAIFIPHVNGITFELVALNYVILQDIGTDDFRIVRI